MLTCEWWVGRSWWNYPPPIGYRHPFSPPIPLCRHSHHFCCKTRDCCCLALCISVFIESLLEMRLSMCWAKECYKREGKGHFATLRREHGQSNSWQQPKVAWHEAISGWTWLFALICFGVTLEMWRQKIRKMRDIFGKMENFLKMVKTTWRTKIQISDSVFFPADSRWRK